MAQSFTRLRLLLSSITIWTSEQRPEERDRYNLNLTKHTDRHPEIHLPAVNPLPPLKLHREKQPKSKYNQDKSTNGFNYIPVFSDFTRRAIPSDDPDSNKWREYSGSKDQQQ